VRCSASDKVPSEQSQNQDLCLQEREVQSWEERLAHIPGPLAHSAAKSEAVETSCWCWLQAGECQGSLADGKDYEV